MARIFLSHSSANNAHALALAEWLEDNGWSDFFLDIETDRGIVPGERWMAALSGAVERCEAVIFLVSPAWQASKFCFAEFFQAKSLGKRIFGVIVEPVELSTLPEQMTAEWQVCDLTHADAPVRVPRGETTARSGDHRGLLRHGAVGAVAWTGQGRSGAVHLRLATRVGTRPVALPGIAGAGRGPTRQCSSAGTRRSYGRWTSYGLCANAELSGSSSSWELPARGSRPSCAPGCCRACGVTPSTSSSCPWCGRSVRSFQARRGCCRACRAPDSGRSVREPWPDSRRTGRDGPARDPAAHRGRSSARH